MIVRFYKYYQGQSCMDWFKKQLKDLAKFIQSTNINIVPMDARPNRDVQQCVIYVKNVVTLQIKS